MYFRCYQRTHKAQARYAAKGIEVCPEWLSSYAAFLCWALANGYSDDLEIDRRDNDKGYYPENCRWVTRSVNQRNTTSASLPVLDAFGDSKTPMEWTEDARSAVGYHLLIKRLRAGWNAETALTVPSQGKAGPRAFSARQRPGYADPGRALGDWRGSLAAYPPRMPSKAP